MNDELSNSDQINHGCTTSSLSTEHKDNIK